jgi:broad specificity phosphatase PhoE
MFVVFTSFPQVSITGIIKNDAGIGIAGADVTLAKKKTLSVKSSGDGSFRISQTGVKDKYDDISIRSQVKIYGSILDFSSDFTGKKVVIALYTLQGTMILNQNVSLTKNKYSIKLPMLSDGIYLLYVKYDGKEYVCRYTNASNGCYGNSGSTSQKPSLLKVSAVIDTLVVSRSGYKTKKTVLESYSQKDIEVKLDSNIVGPPDTLKKGLTIYLIRHAETVANASGEIGGGGPIENHDTLTTLGEKQVEELTNYLIKENIKPDLVIVSPTSRTQKTIEPFLIASKMTAQIWVELNECCGQEPNGDPIPTERPKPAWKMKIERLSDNFTFRTAEDIYYWWPQSYEEGLFMVMTARDRVLELFSQSGKTVMIVGHAANGGILLGLLQGYDMLTTKPSKPAYLMNTGVQKLVQDTITGKFTVKMNINKPLTQ